MKEQNNATCSICGSSYHLCIHCKDAMKLSPWKIHCCSSECYKVFQIVKGFNSGVYTKEEAKEKFENVDLRNLGNFIPHIKKIVKDILKEEKKEVVEIVEKVDIVDEVKADEVDSAIIKEEIPVVEKTTYSRKRNYKVNDEVKEAE